MFDGKTAIIGALYRNIIPSAGVLYVANGKTRSKDKTLLCFRCNFNNCIALYRSIFKEHGHDRIFLQYNSEK